MDGIEIGGWQPGTQITLYEMWGEGIGTARPVTVVEDTLDHLALYSHPGTTILTRGIENRHSLKLSDRIDQYMQALDPSVGEFRERTPFDSHVLTLTPPDSWRSIWLFWTLDWQFKNWYVNLQSPMRRVHKRVQIHDYVLDIVVQPDLSWSWKDMDEFEELIVRGFFSAEQVRSIRAEAERVVEVIKDRGVPFCDGWENWRPQAHWSVPILPDNPLS